jgi:hypothetical protein
VRDRLRQLTEAMEQATPGPWAQHPSDGEYVIGEVSADGDSYLDVADTYAFRKQTGYDDAAAIVAAHNNLPWLVAALTAAVFDLHTSDGAETPFCNECGHTYPCLTVRAVVAAAGGEGE